MKKVIATEHAPAAIGPYSQGVAAGEMIWISGQLPIDMETGLLETADIAVATAHCLRNIQAILREGGVDLSNVVKATVFLSDLADFAKMNEVYGRFFAKDPPARSCVQVSALPKGALIEIEAVALRG